MTTWTFYLKNIQKWSLITLKNATKMLPSIERCVAVYVTGKHKGERCQASPHSDSNFCLKHRHKDPKIKEYYKADPKVITELLKNIKLNDQ